MVHRTLSRQVRRSATRNPAVTLTGPRQSGKTTLCRAVFPDHAYRNLDLRDVHNFALEDPRGFLADAGGPVILDEIQRAPDLLPYIQAAIDEDQSPGRFILTGSHKLSLVAAVSQSLAGRTAMLQLMPLSFEELQGFDDAPRDLWEIVFRGGYPAIYERRLPPSEWLGDYVQNYVERDVRTVLGVGDLRSFQTFLGLCAGRVGQLLNLSGLAADAGVSQPTAKAWLSVLEATFVAHALPPYFANVRKRLVKTPKLHMFDTGVVCSLLGITSAEVLAQHPLRGAIFETWVVGEVLKAHVHRGQRPRLFHYRDRSRLEVDLIVNQSTSMTAVEIKSGRTVAGDFFAALQQFEALFSGSPASVDLRLVYGGEAPQVRQGVTVVPWSELASGFGPADLAE